MATPEVEKQAQTPDRNENDFLREVCDGAVFGDDLGLDDKELETTIQFILSDPTFPDYIEKLENILSTENVK